MLLDEISTEAKRCHAGMVMARTARIVVRSEAFQADPHGEMGRHRVAVGLNAKPDTLHGDDPAPADWRHMQAWHGGVMSSSTCPSPRDCARTRRDPAP